MAAWRTRELYFFLRARAAFFAAGAFFAAFATEVGFDFATGIGLAASDFDSTY